jgi:hypothetical protein
VKRPQDRVKLHDVTVVVGPEEAIGAGGDPALVVDDDLKRKRRVAFLP